MSLPCVQISEPKAYDTINFDFYKLKLVQDIIVMAAEARTKLFEELLVHALDPTIKMRRFRMLRQLSQFESQMIEKIWRFETDDPRDLYQFNWSKEIESVISRDA